MKIKIIDIMNKIANGEELPKKIKYWNKIWELDYDDGCYFYAESDGITLLLEIIVSTRQLNDEVEVLEEEKKIPEKLGLTAYVDGEIAYSWSKSEAALKGKINEIIDCLNYLKSKGDE